MHQIDEGKERRLVLQSVADLPEREAFDGQHECSRVAFQECFAILPWSANEMSPLHQFFRATTAHEEHLHYNTVEHTVQHAQANLDAGSPPQ
jgi:hypothetical protein